MIRSGYISSVIQLTNLRNVNPEVEKEELLFLKSILDDITRKEVVSFSFAYGSYNYDLINHTFD
jgi:peptidoglycan/xylan/chitin deacetylase (PgdA/CDA1 family)